ncbi:amidohydrolase family protein [Streptomyces litchfieldiae]|uniref:Amidohydrolase family protein n=1 Tax=Streptomyces litchfieldiae TaxID=3075543 RepID=A0ABU2MQ98_9ACTN|nr:amidohydrolase family protein [Streptomyces sp. DSM 44938]MDT0343796.1 amidohydrolase family protein [Streptomyces sp. DSM 44938]
MSRVDAHHHVWDLARRPQPWLTGPRLGPLHRTFTPAELAGPAAAAGVTRTVLVQVLADAEETADFLALADRSELVAGVVGWADLTRGAAVAGQLAGLRAGPGGELLAGVRHLVQGEADPRWLCRPDVRAGLAAVADAGLVYDLLVLPGQLPAAIETVRALPGLTFVLDHLAKPPIATGEREPWAGLVRRLAAEPNVVCKLSGMVTEADPDHWTVRDLRPYAETVLEAFGPDRLMFGSDWPVCLAAADYAEVVEAAVELTAGLSPDERTAVFGATAARVYGLGPV